MFLIENIVGSNNATTIFNESIIRKESDSHGVHCNANVSQDYEIFYEVSKLYIALFFDIFS